MCLRRNMLVIALVICAALACPISGRAEHVRDMLPAYAALEIKNALDSQLTTYADALDAPWLASTLAGGILCTGINVQEKNSESTELELALRFLSLKPNPSQSDITAILAPVNEYSTEIIIPVKAELRAGRIVYTCDARAAAERLSPYAESARIAFDDPRTRIAIADMLLPCPIYDASSAPNIISALATYEYTPAFERLMSSVDADLHAPLALLMLAQREQRLLVSYGPETLILRCVGADPERLASSALEQAELTLRQTPMANSFTEQRIHAISLAALTHSVLEVRSGIGTSTYEIELDAFKLLRGEAGDSYRDYLGNFVTAYSNGIRSLIDITRSLPDYPEQPFPETGMLETADMWKLATSRACIISPDGEYARLVKLSGKVNMSCFIRPGETCMLSLPRGKYSMFIASGKRWYGEVELFGETTAYTRTAPVEIGSDDYFYKFTIYSDSDGNIASWPISADEFLSGK